MIHPKAYLHIPGDIPKMSKPFLRIPFGQEVTIYIKAGVMITSDALRDYNPNRRRCYFEKERYLRFFKTYSYMNCELECLTNHTLATCGCVKFSMPRNSKDPVCGYSKIYCYKKAKKDWIKLNFEEEKWSDMHVKHNSKCNCLPSCMDIEYDSEISQADYDSISHWKAYGFANETSKKYVVYES